MDIKRGVFVAVLILGFVLFFGEVWAGVINPPNNPPVISILPEIVVCEGSSLSQPFLVTTFSSPTEVSVSPADFSVDLPVLANIGDNVLTLQSGILGGSAVGQHVIGITASSGMLSSSAETILNVVATNRAPSIDADAIISRPGIFAYQLPVSDEGSGSLEFNLSGGPKHITIDNKGIIRAVLSPPGNYTVYVCVKDSGLPSSNSSSAFCASENGPKVTCKSIILSSVPGWNERVRVISGSWNN